MALQEVGCIKQSAAIGCIKQSVAKRILVMQSERQLTGDCPPIGNRLQPRLQPGLTVFIGPLGM